MFLMSNEVTPLEEGGTPAGQIVTTEGIATQTADTPGNDENGDGLTGGQTTADNYGDVLGL
jgi:hypothetical protein